MPSAFNNSGFPVADANYFNNLGKPATTPGSSPDGKKPSGVPYQARGAGTNFAADKYTVGSLQYPSDLMSNNNIYGGNYAIFYINVQADSKLLKDASYATVSDPSAIPPRQRGDAVALNTGKAGAVGTSTATGAVLGALGGAIGLGAGGGIAGAVVGGGLGLAAGGAAATQAAGFSRQTKRLKQVIALYMPEDLNIKYSIDWSEEETAMAAALYSGADMFASIYDSSRKSSIGQAASQLGAGVAYGALKMPVTGNYTSAQTGLAVNPKKEQIFKGVKYRDFTLSFKFYPRSAEEANNINQIVNAFKLHMHPEFKDAYNFLYIYPSEFDIYYYNNGQENMNLHRHTSVVLTDLDVAYTPQGVFTAFTDGMPTQVNIVMSFRELALLTKDNILDGF